MNAILSIKPQFAEKIFSGQKKYEYRKFMFKKPVHKVFVYATFPVCKIVGEFTLQDFIIGTPKQVWNKTKNASGIDLNCFDKYFAGRSQAYALCISSYKRYTMPIDPKQLFPHFKAPQSFCYIHQS